MNLAHPPLPLGINSVPDHRKFQELYSRSLENQTPGSLIFASALTLVLSSGSKALLSFLAAKTLAILLHKCLLWFLEWFLGLYDTETLRALLLKPSNLSPGIISVLLLHQLLTWLKFCLLSVPQNSHFFCSKRLIYPTNLSHSCDQILNMCHYLFFPFFLLTLRSKSPHQQSMRNLFTEYAQDY